MTDTTCTSPEGVLSPKNPWPGPGIFSEASADYFYGRSEETRELALRLHRELLTVLYGRSGMGKTSLLKAGLFPVARKQNILPVWIRLGFGKDDPSPEQQIRAALIQTFEACQIDALHPTQNESLWDYFHRKDLVFWTPDFRRVSLLLVFDQFEETFTLACPEDRDALLKLLSDIATNSPPDETRKRIEANPDDILTLDLERKLCKLLFSMREDFLPDLDGLGDIFPGLLDNKYRLQGMDDAQGREVILGPGKHLLSAEVAQQVLDYVAGKSAGPLSGSAKRIEPVLLSVVLFELNLRRGEGQITPELLGDCKANILEAFYDSAFQDLPDDAQRMVEDELLTKSDRRDTTAWENAASYEGLTEAHIATLVERHLLRREETTAGARVELIHDRLAEVAVQRRNTRRQREKEEQDRKEREETARKERQARKRQRCIYAIGCFVILALSGLLACSMFLYREAEKSKQDAENSQQKTEDTAKLATRAKEVIDSFSKSITPDAVNNNSLEEKYPEDIVDALTDKIAQYYEIPEVKKEIDDLVATNADPLRGYILCLYSIAVRTSENQKKVDCYSKALKEIENIMHRKEESERFSKLYVVILDELGCAFSDGNQYEEAKKVLEKGVERVRIMAEGKLEDTELQRIRCSILRHAGDVLLDCNKNDDATNARDRYQECLDTVRRLKTSALEKAKQNNNPMVRKLGTVQRVGSPSAKNAWWHYDELESLNGISTALFFRDQYQDALTSYEETLKVTLEFAATNSTDTVLRHNLAVTLKGICEVLSAKEGNADAGSHFQKYLKDVTEQESGNTSWQINLSSILRAAGDMIRNAGRKERALDAYRESLRVTERLISIDQANTMLQYTRSQCLASIGDTLMSLEKREEALDAYQKGLKSVCAVTILFPDNTEYRTGLSNTLKAIAITFAADKKDTSPDERFEKCLNDIAERKSKNPGWENALYNALNITGDQLAENGNQNYALQVYGQSLRVVRKLISREPYNLKRQYDLSAILSEFLIKVGDAQLSLIKLQEALNTYQESLAIMRKLVDKDPENTRWQENLHNIFDRVGSAQLALNKPQDAFISFQESLAFKRKLVEKDPENTEWQNDLSVNFILVGSAQLALNRPQEALTSYQESLVIMRKLVDKDSENTVWQYNLYHSFNSIGSAQLALDKPQEALTSFQDALVVSRKLVDKDPKNTDWQNDLSWSLDRVGDAHLALNKPQDAFTSFQESQAIMRKLVEKDPENTNWQENLHYIFDRVGNAQLALNKPQDAFTSFQESLAIMRKLVDKEPENTDWQQNLYYSLDSIGDTEVALDKPQEALTTYQESQAIMRKLVDKEPENTKWQQNLYYSLDGIGDTEVALDKHQEALTSYQESQAIMRKLVDKEPENTKWQQNLYYSLDSIGNTQLALDKPQDALTSYQESLAIMRKLVDKGPENSDWQQNLYYNLNNIGDTQLALDKPQDALTSYQESLAIMRKLVDKEPENADWQQNLNYSLGYVGEAQIALDKRQEALTSYQESLAIMRKLVDKDPENADWKNDLSMRLINVGYTLVALDKPQEALTSYQESLAIIRKLVDKEPENTPWQVILYCNLNNIGDTQVALDKPQEALTSYQESLAIMRKLVDKEPENTDWQKYLYYSLDDIGKAQLAINKPHEALTSYQKSLDTIRKLADKDPKNTEWQEDLCYCLGYIGNTQLVLGRKDDARKQYKEALQKINERDNAPVPESAWFQELLNDFPAARKTLEQLPEEKRDEASSLCMEYAHALLFTGDEEKARALYMKHKGKCFSDGRLWNKEVKTDFDTFRRLDITHPQMDEIEKRLAE